MQMMTAKAVLRVKKKKKQLTKPGPSWRVDYYYYAPGEIRNDVVVSAIPALPAGRVCGQRNDGVRRKVYVGIETIGCRRQNNGL